MAQIRKPEPQTAGLRCPNCRGPLPERIHNQLDMKRCMRCGTQLQVHVFPAYHHKQKSSGTGETVDAGEDQASCFFHPKKKAVQACDDCGRLLCALCDIQQGERRVCAKCLVSGKQDKTRFLYGTLSLLLSFVPILAPVSMYLAVIGFWRPYSLVARYQAHFQVLAILISGLQLLWMGALIVLGIARR